jgi:hypothetical protein
MRPISRCWTWGGEIRPEVAPKPGEIVAAEHWCSSGFANTDFGFAALRDATTDYSDEAMHAALDINIPNYASAIVSAEEIVARMSAL